MIRESQLAAGQIAAGVTALGKAHHACTAYYHQAFFGLSIGMERLCKQILIADYAINNSGAFPAFKQVKAFGHKLDDLIAACDEVGKRFKPDRRNAIQPSTDIHQSIVSVLTEFADGTRYSNLNLLTGASTNTHDPVARWWTEVGIPICESHYSDKARQRDKSEAMLMSMLMEGVASVIHTDETGTDIDDFETFAMKAGPTAIAQRYGRRYVLQIVRWLGSLAYQLAMEGGYAKRIPALFCFHEPYSIFNLTDAHILKKKTYSPEYG